MNTLISVIVPVYHGNQYLPGLVKNIEDVGERLEGHEIELILVNDSPEEELIPLQTTLQTKIITNEKNRGIHYSRVAGLKAAAGEWVVFLDQDDLLIAENYKAMVEQCNDADVIVGNGYYYRNGEKQLNFKNQRVMEYEVQQGQLLRIRNLIPSPGEVLIRRSAVPKQWQENILQHSGADDWMLWLMLFAEGARFKTVDEKIYIHRSTNSGNLSFDLKKMWVSAHEMVEILRKSGIYTAHQLSTLSRAIDFKYYQDSRSIKPWQWIYYIDRVIDNTVYKLKTR